MPDLLARDVAVALENENATLLRRMDWARRTVEKQPCDCFNSTDLWGDPMIVLCDRCQVVEWLTPEVVV